MSHMTFDEMMRPARLLEYPDFVHYGFHQWLNHGLSTMVHRSVTSFSWPIGECPSIQDAKLRCDVVAGRHMQFCRR